jgi:uncharacterized membrane protein
VPVVIADGVVWTRISVEMTHQLQPDDGPTKKKRGVFYPFRVAVFRGLGVLLPPLLTIVIFLWIGGTIDRYVVVPVTNLARDRLVWWQADVRHGILQVHEVPRERKGDEIVIVHGLPYRRVEKPKAGSVLVVDGVTYRREVEGPATDRDLTYIRKDVYDFVSRQLPADEIPLTARGIFERYIELKYLTTYHVILIFTPLFIFVIYLLGKFMANRIGRLSWGLFESAIRRVPLVSNVYSPVKQVSDFLLNDRDIRATRVVAVEWPRKGVWTLGLVTGESMQDIEAAANEPVLSVLICTSPMPMTGFTVTVRSSETLDLNISIDQAFQFVISCGVVIPPAQLRKLRESPTAPPRLTGSNNSDSSKADEKHVVKH